MKRSMLCIAELMKLTLDAHRPHLEKLSVKQLEDYDAIMSAQLIILNRIVDTSDGIEKEL